MLDRLLLTVLASQRRFPGGRRPFMIVSRLAEECGELSAEVQHWEGLGLKREKHGEPDPSKTAKEVMDVLTCALEVALHYGLLEALEERIEFGIERAHHAGLLSDDEVTMHR